MTFYDGLVLIPDLQKFEVFMSIEKKLTILCIDDYENTLLGQRMLLEGEGYDVVSSTDWRAGLQVFASQTIDEVILDYEMPEITGDIVASCMKQTKPNVPILMVSEEYSLPKNKLKQVEAFISKMEPIAIFLTTVKALLEHVPHHVRESEVCCISRSGN
jgi:CheY-like chemotaxis protein